MLLPSREICSKGSSTIPRLSPAAVGEPVAFGCAGAQTGPGPALRSSLNGSRIAGVAALSHGIRRPHPLEKRSMNLHFALTPLVSLIAGILILAVPRLLNYIVAIYLILIGLLGLFGSGALHLH